MSDPLTHPCPTCGVRPGQKCRNYKDQHCAPHGARLAKAGEPAGLCPLYDEDKRWCKKPGLNQFVSCKGMITSTGCKAPPAVWRLVLTETAKRAEALRQAPAAEIAPEQLSLF